jgi:hypothetical protein
VRALTQGRFNVSFEDIQRSLGRIEGEISVRGKHCRKTKPRG